MRDHFHRYGFYRREDLERLLGKPGDSVSVTVNGAIVYRSASGMEAPSGGETVKQGSTEGNSPAPKGDAQ